MQQRSKPHYQSQRLFTASEIASYEYCALSWWHEQFDPMAQGSDDELFARLVELEAEHDAQAPSLSEYQVIEQLLLRRGAFEGENVQSRGQAEEEEIEEERVITPGSGSAMRHLRMVILILTALALVLIVASAFLRT